MNLAARARLAAGVLAAATGAAGAQTTTAAPAATATIAEPTIGFTVGPRDTLIGLSRDVFATPDAWREIARLNRLPDANRIRPGQTLQVPVRLLRQAALPATVTVVQGEVTLRAADGRERPAVAGQPLQAGESLRTGEAGSAVLALADGSQVKLAPRTEARLDEHRRYVTRRGAADLSAPPAAADEGWFAGTMRLLQGSLEVLASTLRRARPLEVTTPTAVIGVRGTDYRVHHAADAQAASRTEVLRGAVRANLPASGGASAAGADVAAGFGAALRPGTPPQVRELLPAPDLAGVPARFERPLVRFAPPAGAGPLRVQVAGDAGFDRIVLDTPVAEGAEVRLAGLSDGDWHLRVRRVDALGLEGRDGSRAFTLAARPEPPALLAPRPGARLPVGRVTLAWAANIEAAATRWQVAADPAFTALLASGEQPLSPAEVTLPQAGAVYWRAASVRAGGSAGPWGDAQGFELRPDPPAPRSGLDADDRLRFGFTARPQDRPQVELASDAGFTQVLQRAEPPSGEWLADATGPGRFYFRYRSTEPDGYVTPWSATLAVDVPRRWRPRWLFAPLLGPDAP